MKKYILKLAALIFAIVFSATAFAACDLKTAVENFLGTNGTTAEHTEHEYDDGVITLDPTCTTDGERTYTCKKCKHSYTEPIPASGHTPGEEKFENITFNICELGGTYEVVTYCSVCGKEMSRRTETLTGKLHDYGDWETVTAPTATTDGERKRTCRFCGKEETEPIPALGVLVELDTKDYYAYNYLKTAENSQTLLYVYNKLISAANDMQDTVTLNNQGYSVTVEQFKTAYYCYKCDYPQHFWVENSYNISFSGNIVSSCKLTYLFANKNARDVAATKVEEAKDELLDGISPYLGETKIETEIHNRLITLNTYDKTYEAPHTHNLYGALVNRTSVCDGYSKAFQYLLYCAGIQCFTVSGVATSPSGSENHAWNVVRLDGDYYYVDVTWDDPIFTDDRQDYIGHSYHNVTTAEISRDHAVGKVLRGGVLEDDNLFFPVPDCTATKANYFKYFGYMSETLSVEGCRTVFTNEKNNGVKKYFAVYFSCGATESSVNSFLRNNRADFIWMMYEVFGKFFYDTPQFLMDDGGFIVTFIIQ